MKKVLTIALVVSLLFAGLFVLTGCVKNDANTNSSTNSNNTNTQKEENLTKVEFTQESLHSRVKYKVPEGTSKSFESFKDMGKSCMVGYYTNQSSVAALYPYDDKVEKVDKVTINGQEYDTYKYVDGLGCHYVYRTLVNNFYHLFTYDVSSQEYDDSQVAAFMNTVEFIDNN